MFSLACIPPDCPQGSLFSSFPVVDLKIVGLLSVLLWCLEVSPVMGVLSSKLCTKMINGDHVVTVSFPVQTGLPPAREEQGCPSEDTVT